MDKYTRKREWRPADGPARHNKQQLLAIGRQLPKTFSLCNRDFRLERYLSFLRQEHDRLGGGPIGGHYIQCAAAAYRTWRGSRCPQSRFAAWLAIKTCAQWLSQLEGGVGR